MTINLFNMKNVWCPKILWGQSSQRMLSAGALASSHEEGKIFLAMLYINI
jgi:hypothetical protein